MEPGAVIQVQVTRHQCSRWEKCSRYPGYFRFRIENCPRSAHGWSEPFVGAAVCSPRDAQSDDGLGSGGLAHAGTTRPCAGAAPPCAGGGPPSAHSPKRLARQEDWEAEVVRLPLPMPGLSVRRSGFPGENEAAGLRGRQMARASQPALAAHVHDMRTDSSRGCSGDSGSSCHSLP